MTCHGCHEQVCACPDPIYAGLTQPPASAVPPCAAPPLAGEVPPRLTGDLVDQGARHGEANFLAGGVKVAAVHIAEMPHD